MQRLEYYLIRPNAELLSLTQKYEDVFEHPYILQIDELGYRRWEITDGIKLLHLGWQQHWRLAIQTEPYRHYLATVLGEPPLTLATFDRWWTIERIIGGMKITRSMINYVSLEALHALSTEDDDVLELWLAKIKRFKSIAHLDEIAISLRGVLTKIVPEGIFQPIDVELQLSSNMIVQSDLFWIAPENTRCTLKDEKWHGAPDLIIEVLSPSTALYDKREKYALYEQNGVREYWLVDPETQLTEIHVLDNAKFQRYGVYASTDKFQSPTLFNREIDLALVFR